MWQNILKKKSLIADAAEVAETVGPLIEPVKEVKEAKIVVDAVKDAATPKMRN